MLAGSSLPVTWRLPSIELPLGCTIDEALMVGNGGSDPMDYHALEAMQCMIERRKGGETGVRSVQMITGPDVWKAGAGRPLVERLAGGSSLTFRHADGADGTGRANAGPGGKRRAPKLVKDPAAYFIEHNDGLKTTLLMLTGAIQDFNFAARVRGSGIQSCQFLLTPVPNVTYSACLVSKIEEMFETGRAPYPADRTLIVSGMLESCLTSKVQGSKRLDTPHLSVRYQAPKESQLPT